MALSKWIRRATNEMFNVLNPPRPRRIFSTILDSWAISGFFKVALNVMRPTNHPSLRPNRGVRLLANLAPDPTCLKFRVVFVEYVFRKYPFASRRKIYVSRLDTAPIAPSTSTIY